MATSTKSGTSKKPAATTTATAPKKAATKPAAPKKAVAAPKKAASPAKPTSAGRAAKTKPAASPEQRGNYIEVAAYYIAERRGFAPGNPLEDWAQAEAEIDRLLAEGKLNV